MINLLGFLLVFLGGIALIILAVRSYKVREKRARKKNGEAPTPEQKKGGYVALPQSNLVLVGGGWLLFNLVVWMVLPGAWAWWISKGLFFWGTQIAIVVLLLLNLVFKEEGNKRPVAVVSLLIAIVLIAGFISQIKWGEDDHTRKQSVEMSFPRGVIKVVAPSEGYSMEEIYVGSSIYWNAPNVALEVMFKKKGMVVWVFKQSPENLIHISSGNMRRLQGATIHFRSLSGKDKPVYVCTTRRACDM